MDFEKCRKRQVTTEKLKDKYTNRLLKKDQSKRCEVVPANWF